MNTLVLDFETYFDDDFSLKKLPTLLYIRHPRFLIHGAAVKVGATPARWIPRDRLTAFLDGVDWSDTILISHNSNFDNTILFEKYGHSPARRVDTLALCRVLLPQDMDFDLGAIAPVLGLGEKGDDLALTKGLRDLPPEIEERLGIYACQDAELEYKLYELLEPNLSDFQRRVMNAIIRMSTEGRMLFNGGLAAEAKVEIDEDRQTKAEFIGLKVLKHPKTGKPWVPQLTSRDQFADLLRAKKIDPPMKKNDKGELTYAFSKQDPDFVRLQADPEAAPIVAARMAWASNNAVSRIEKLIAITGFPPHTLPVQLNVSGAHTHRESGGGGINEQNLNRGSKLRRAHRAPPGYVILVVDSSQIELRLNMWFSGQNDVIEFLTPGEYVFGDASVEWKGGDIYRLEASRQFGIETGAVDKNQRQFGKIVQLGCFAGETQVLVSKHGIAAPTYKRIDSVTVDDWVWDGIEWVRHNGLVRRGIKEVMTLDGVRVTPDHLVLSNDQTWEPAQYLERDANTLLRALEIGSANLPSPGSNSENEAVSHTSSFNVAAALRNIEPHSTTCSKAAQLDATHAQRSNPGTTKRSIWGTPTSSRKMPIEHAYSIAFQRVCSAVITRMTRAIQTTVDEVSAYTRDGAKIAAHFLRTSVPSMGGTALSWSWIAKTSTLGTNPATSSSLQKRPIREIDGASATYNNESTNSKQKTPVYDLALAGPRSRFTIRTDSGHLIVHNCGYQMGSRRFRVFCATGPLGVKPIYLTEDEAWRTIHNYRSQHPWVKASWEWNQYVAIPALLTGAKAERGPIVVEKEQIVLPHGYTLQYPDIRGSDDEEEGASWVWGINGMVHRIYGGITQENEIQALAGIFIKEKMLEIEDTFNLEVIPVHSVHDEIICLCPENRADEALRIIATDIMSKAPEWAPGLPVRAEGGYDVEYSK